MNHALLLVEHDGRAPHPGLRRLLGAARLLAGRISLLVAGHDCQAVAEQVAHLAGVDAVLLCETPALAHAPAELLAPLLAEALRAEGASALLAAATPFGKAILPRAAALLDCAMVSDICAILDPETFVRPLHAGAALATLHNPEPLKILSVRTAAFAPVGEQAAAPIRPLPCTVSARCSSWLARQNVTDERPPLHRARVVVAGGRGLGDADTFHALLDPLAERLDAALGATRAAVDAGFIDNAQQVGQTGAIVAPEFYFAVGLSGAAQHLAGMRDARVVVAINTDPTAPICRHADYVLEMDVKEALPALLAALGPKADHN